MGQFAEIIACPECGSKLFEDMYICFDCMHVFSEETEKDSTLDAELEAKKIDSKDRFEISRSDRAEIMSLEFDSEKLMLEAQTETTNVVCCESNRASETQLFSEFLIEFEGFLRKFLVDREIHIK